MRTISTTATPTVTGPSEDREGAQCNSVDASFAALRIFSIQRMLPPFDVQKLLKEGIARLNSANVPSSSLAAELVLMHALGRDRTWLYAHSDETIDLSLAQKYFALVSRRISGEPTQYIIGKQEFWGLEFEVTPAVLIPRPETEHLIEVALDRFTSKRNSPLRIADVGTGSGCIAVALAKGFPQAKIIATDISPTALEVAKRNAQRNEAAASIEFVETDLLGTLFHKSQVTSHKSQLESHQSPVTDHQSRLFDLIVSNPPYVARNEAQTLQREVRDHEPEIALFGGETGVEIYGRLIDQAEKLLAPGGVLILELGYGAAEEVREIIDKRRTWQNISITNDLAGIPRVLAAQRA